MSEKLRVEKIPEWFKIANKDALFSAKDVTRLFGYSMVQSLDASRRQGYFPKADKVLKGTSSRSKVFWKKSTLLKEIQRRNNELCV